MSLPEEYKTLRKNSKPTSSRERGRRESQFPDASKPMLNYEYSERNLVPRLNPLQQKIAEDAAKNRAKLEQAKKTEEQPA